MPTLGSGQTPAQAINEIYLAVLRRDAEPLGLSFWEAQFNAGTSLDSIRDLIVASSESSSFVDPIVRLYEVAFGRQANDAELTNSVNSLRSGATLETIAEGFAGSQEFIDRFGTGADRSTFVENLYRNGLDRASDVSGKAFWVGSDFTNAQLLLGFSESTESVARLDDATVVFLANLSEGIAANTSAPLTAVLSDQPLGPSITIIGGAGNDRLGGGLGDDTIDGGAGDDTIDGGAGDDTITGGAGDDTLTGASGDDRFIFSDGSGNDTITDFVAGEGTDDVLNITAFGFASFADVINAASQVGTNTLIQLDVDDSVTLLGVTLSDLDPSDVLI